MEKKIIRTTLPLTDEQLDIFFDNMEDYYFLIDIDKSKYDAKLLLTYIYNSSMKADFIINTYSQKLASLLTEYILTDRLISVPILNKMWCDILIYKLKKDKFKFDSKYVAFLDKYLNDNKALINNVLVFIASLKCYLLDKMGIIQAFKIKKENTNIKNNFISIRESEYFWLVFALIDEANITPKYYKIFDDFCFDGYNIAHYFLEEFNPLGIISMASKEG